MLVISSILNPGPFEMDFRPFIGVLLFMVVSILIVVIKYWKHFKNDFYSDWE